MLPCGHAASRSDGGRTNRNRQRACTIEIFNYTRQRIPVLGVSGLPQTALLRSGFAFGCTKVAHEPERECRICESVALADDLEVHEQHGRHEIHVRERPPISVDSRSVVLQMNYPAVDEPTKKRGRFHAKALDRPARVHCLWCIDTNQPHRADARHDDGIAVDNAFDAQHRS